MEGTAMRPDLLVFDVNETLLDLRSLRPAFEAALGSADPMGEWFARMLHGSLVSNHVRNYRPFDLIGAESLMVVAQRRGIDLSPDRAAAVVSGMRRLPAHAEVPVALDRMAAAGYRLVTLTNGSSDAVADQLAYAAIADRFEAVLSVDAVGRFKPAPEVYLHACATLGVEVDRALMVAAHDWDIAGARSVGLQAAFIARPGVVWGLPDDPPDLVTADLAGLADLLAPESGGAVTG